ncbi:LysR substrate-binding domain-containing protein [Mesorhizobium sp.]|uniref:LysR family transcriptional regulator n=1 Tax=Mesorhizobium sp. TaxID=1871066 RepID=UPI003BA8A93A
MSDRLQELAVFVRIAERGGFSRAAGELGLSQPSVSRIVNDLEARLGVKLLLRTTRKVTVTEAGAAFLERARQLLHNLEEAEDSARGIDSLRGLIRIALPVTFGTRKVIPLLQPFLAAHPLLRLDLIMSDDRQDLVAEGVDLAIRLGELTSSGFGARRLATSPRLVIASPAYLALRGIPRTPADLAAHDCVFGPGITARQSWSFLLDGAAMSVEIEGRINTTSGEGMMACVTAGLGIAVASEWMCGNDLASGSVVQVLHDFKLTPAIVNAVYPGGPHPSAKVRALVDHLAVALASEGRAGSPSAIPPPRL